MRESLGRTVVVSQPMYFPWVGQLEQVRLADAFVFYDDVQFARGFFNRVQIKTAGGIRWMTVPLRDQHRGQLISETQIDERVDWRRSHLDAFRQAYARAPFLDDAITVMADVFAKPVANLAELSMASTLALVQYFELESACEFLRSSEGSIEGHGTQRLIDLCAAEQAKQYLTGHGARHYLDHEQFEARGMGVSYIEYGCAPYPQQHGAFTPYVTALDLVAHCGRQGRELIGGRAVSWREFVGQQAPAQDRK
ncbi:MAG: WbqC family protein [Castellaniella sp.]|uniref:WbqC family protein n=1 Tax=Castellaniella sp. TaxID=1955812 RepID=UPI003C718C75